MYLRKQMRFVETQELYILHNPIQYLWFCDPLIEAVSYARLYVDLL